jgi:hypothetical protein
VRHPSHSAPPAAKLNRVRPSGRPQPALQQQEEPHRRLALLGDDVDHLDHRPGDEHRVEVVAEGMERLDERHLGDRVQVAPLVQQQVDVAERLEPAPEPALGAPDPLGHGAQLAVVGAEQDHDPVGLPERVAAQHDSLVTPETHRARLPGTMATPGVSSG